MSVPERQQLRVEMSEDGFYSRVWLIRADNSEIEVTDVLSAELSIDANLSFRGANLALTITIAGARLVPTYDPTTRGFQIETTV